MGPPQFGPMCVGSPSGLGVGSLTDLLVNSPILIIFFFKRE